MTLSAALLFSLACLHTAIAAPTPQDAAQVACQVEVYTVEKTEKAGGKSFMSTDTCSGSGCTLTPKSDNAWTVVPLVSDNLKTERFNDGQYNQIALDAYAIGKIQAAPGQQDGGKAYLTCDGASECGLVVTPQYVHIVGTRTYAANCAPAEPFEMWLAQTDGAAAVIETKACSKGEAAGSSMSACPSTEAWVDQVVPSDLPAGTFAKVSYKEPHGSGYRYRVRFNKGNPNFSNAGEEPGVLFLNNLNARVYTLGGDAATADAHNWQEYTDGTSEIADFDFDPVPAQPQADVPSYRTGSTNAGVCKLVAKAVSYTSGLRADAGAGICDSV